MRIQVSGRQIDIGDALRSHVAEGLTEATSKYAGRPTDAQVVFGRDGHAFTCEATVHLSTGLNAQATGRDAEIYQAFEQAKERMAKQLRRHKRRLKDHHKDRPQPVESVTVGSYVLAPLADDSDHDEDHPAEAGPAIIAETATRLPSLTVGEAVLQMELAHAPVLIFRNELRDSINVVYRREDGNIGWIDPSSSPGAT